MTSKILYLGDTSLQTAASYLAGCLHRAGHAFDYVPSDQPLTQAHVADPHQLYIFSDYPATNASDDVQKQIIEHVRKGSNLLMIGGWESFHGMGGNWDGTPLSEILPVIVSSIDDRRNCDSPVFLKAQSEHPILESLPWEARTPLIGGYNKVTPRPDAQILLTAERYSASLTGEEHTLSHVSSDPLLLVTQHKASRLAVLMTDLAPHWVGPLVDWGDERVSAEAPDAGDIEVGNLYFQFVSQLINWVGQYSR